VMWVWATYDAETGQLDPTNSTWVWSGSAWTQACSNCLGPKPMQWGTMAFDPNLGEIVMYVGLATDGTGEYQTYAWTGSSWANVTPASGGPQINSGLAAATDWATNRVVMYAGNAGTWEWNGTTWTKETGTQPTPRYSTAMAYDPTSNGVILMGGSTEGSGPATQSDTWLLTGGNWSQQTLIGTPGFRENESLADGSAAGQGSPLLLFGGEDEYGKYLSDTWTLGGEPALPSG